MAALRRLLICFVACGLTRAAPTAAQAAAQARTPVPAWRLALADTLERSLRKELLDAWYPRAIDREQGGFLSQFDYRWRPTGPQQKMIVTQARHVWTNARAAQFFPADKRFLAGARHGFPFLRDVMWDRQHGGFFWLVTRDGRPVPERDGRFIKQAYGNAFGIYAAAAYYDVARDTSALHLAQRAFRWLDEHAHDPVHLGYFNYMERDGTALRSGYAATPRPGVAPTPPKDQNSSIHILEALTELYRVWPDSVVRNRLAEMLSLIRDRIREDPGTLRQFSLADWTPVSFRDSSVAARTANYYLDHVSYGHDVETAYLMLEASRALGLRDDTSTLRAGKQMVDHALRTGFDTAVGGFYDRGYYLKDRPGITIVLDAKNWWAQAEGLNTLLLMADRFPDDPLRYRERFRQQWSYVNRYLIDHQHGGWYEGGLDREPQRRLGLKGHIWKAAYHDGRALMNVVRRLRAPDADAPSN